MSEFYVYLHRRASDNTPFYVGKGKGQRAWHFYNRNRYWNNVKEKHGVIVEVIFDNLTEEESLQVEKDTILELTYFGYPLTNLTSGGEGATPSLETRLKMSISRKGRKMSEESIKKTADWHRGRKRSEETCQRISDSLKGKKVPRERAIRSGLSRTGVLSAIADKTIYSFLHENGTQFTGTRLELCEKFNLNRKLINKLFYTKPRKTSQSWSLIGEINDGTSQTPKS